MAYFTLPTPKIHTITPEFYVETQFIMGQPFISFLRIGALQSVQSKLILTGLQATTFFTFMANFLETRPFLIHPISSLDIGHGLKFQFHCVGPAHTWSYALLDQSKSIDSVFLFGPPEWTALSQRLPEFWWLYTLGY